MQYAIQNISKLSYAVYFLFAVLSGCKNETKQLLYEANFAFSSLDQNFKMIAKDFELLIIHQSYNELELRKEYKMFALRNDKWCKLLYISDSKNKFQKKKEEWLSEVDGKIIFLGLKQFQLFNIVTEDILLAEHKKLCGIPQDPSHFLTFDIIIISSVNVRKLRYNNPEGRYEMCPAIKNWQNAARINEIFDKKWGN